MTTQVTLFPWYTRLPAPNVWTAVCFINTVGVYSEEIPADPIQNMWRSWHCGTFSTANVNCLSDQTTVLTPVFCLFVLSWRNNHLLQEQKVHVVTATCAWIHSQPRYLLLCCTKNVKYTKYKQDKSEGHQIINTSLLFLLLFIFIPVSVEHHHRCELNLFNLFCSHTHTRDVSCPRVSSCVCPSHV